MKKQDSFFTDTRNELEAYLQDRLLLIKLQTVEKTSQVAGKLFSALIIALLSFFILLFISIMAGYFFAQVTGSLYIGFGIVAAFYIILLLVVLKLRKQVIERRVTDEIIQTIFDKTDDI
jgi:uncharacterized membrane protein YdjX (TVP38/TMEM64 family)